MKSGVINAFIVSEDYYQYYSLSRVATMDTTPTSASHTATTATALTQCCSQQQRQKNRRTKTYVIFSIPWIFFSPSISFLLCLFLDASTNLYNRVCPSVRLSVRPSICPSVGPSVRNAFFFESSKTPIFGHWDGWDWVGSEEGWRGGTVVTGGDDGWGRIWRLVSKLVPFAR